MARIPVNLTPAITGVIGEMWVGLLVGGDLYWYYLIDTPPSVNGLMDFGYADGYPISPHQIRFPEQTINGITYLATQTNGFMITQDWTFNITLTPKEAPVQGHIFDVHYWYGGMSQWREVWPIDEYVPPPMGYFIYFSPRWRNDGTITVTGHMDIEVTSPSGVKYNPSAYSGQDSVVAPGGYGFPRFNYVPLTESGTWTLKATLTCDGVFCDERTINFTVEAPADISTSLTLEVPGSAGPGATVNFSGKLTRADAQPPGIQTIKLIDDVSGTVKATVSTDNNGNYSGTFTVPSTEGTYYYASEFAGATIGSIHLGPSSSRAALSVGAQIPYFAIVPIVAGLVIART